MEARFCPRCRKTPPEGADVCPEHHRYPVTAAALEKLAQAPLLGRALEDRYALLDWIGGGGMGSIYAGVDLRLDRPVAIKLLNAVVTQTKDAQDRFDREARSMSKLHSQHTVTLFDYGLIKDGALANVAFMVMELVEGQSLAQAIHGKGRMRGEQAAEILRQLAKSLSEAHSLGIVHRDVKPDNILLSHTHDGQLLVKLIDFGIARTGEATLTSVGAFLGTPQYMSPEQCSPDQVTIDGRADQYACAIVLYELLSKRLPFDHEQPLKVIYAHLYDDLPSLPNAGGSAQLAALEGVLKRALSKDPEERYPDIQAFSEAFNAAVVAHPSENEDWSVEEEEVEASPAAAPTTAKEIHTQFLVEDGLEWRPPRRGGVLLRALLILMVLSGVSWGVYVLGVQQIKPADAGVVAPLGDASVVRIGMGGALKPMPPKPQPPKPVRKRIDASAPKDATPPKPKKSARPKRGVTRSRARTTKLKARLTQALERCKCGEAKEILRDLHRLIPSKERRALKRRVDRCKRPDVDQICVKGRVKSH